MTYTSSNHTILERLEVTADSSNPSVKRCGQLLHRLFLSLQREDPTLVLETDKDFFKRAFHLFEQGHESGQEDEELFPGMYLLVPAIRRGIPLMGNIDTYIVPQIKGHLAGISAPSGVIERFVDCTHQGMLAAMRAAASYAPKKVAVEAL